MNKRNFFKGLMALLAMPANIYAKVFETRPRAPRILERVLLKDLDVKSFGQVRTGMFFTTTAEWGLNESLFEIVGFEQSNCAFVKPCRPRLELQGWPSGMSRKLDFTRAKFSEFTFYARA